MNNIDDIIINKSQSIQRCVARARQEYNSSENFDEDFSKQDAASMNMLRACQQTIDLANHLIKKLKLGIAKETREIFDMLHKHNIIEEKLMLDLKKMVSFRNIATHEYTNIEGEILKNVIVNESDTLTEFTEVVKSY